MAGDRRSTYCPPEVFAEEWDRRGAAHRPRGGVPGLAHEGAVEEIATPRGSRRRSSRTPSPPTRRRRRRVGEEIDARARAGGPAQHHRHAWREHLYEMDYLQEGIHLRGYAQKRPDHGVPPRGFDMFEELTSTIQTEFVRYIYRVELVRPESSSSAARQRVQENRVRESHGDDGGGRPVGAGAEPASGHQRQGAQERTVPLRQRPEVQEVPRRRGVGAEPNPARRRGRRSRRPLELRPDGGASCTEQSAGQGDAGPSAGPPTGRRRGLEAWCVGRHRADVGAGVLEARVGRPSGGGGAGFSSPTTPTVPRRHVRDAGHDGEHGALLADRGARVGEPLGLGHRVTDPGRAPRRSTGARSGRASRGGDECGHGPDREVRGPSPRVAPWALMAPPSRLVPSGPVDGGDPREVAAPKSVPAGTGST